ncbi:uncharacterized protein LOC110022541 isoform X3 [Phalaenopsis equestris]|uniref:uncharacterized protein LOC110022541 isoform X2 n=1 Tax=Phalaenopsis equestris TaxID=78828 RepID=UPI0009E2D662|nr:uncharacterized protein LOC110022541 isoform X2 [Phalaenopsis equestris]XP_020577197.1 uncharacterized protein LOC110022541 isoform X3 [Phalaenopsis equestris]
MARFTANGGLRLLLHGERSGFGGEPKEPIRFRVCGERWLNNPVRVRSRGRSGWHQGNARVRVFPAGRKGGNTKVGEGFDDTDVEEEEEDDEEEDDEFGVDELAFFRGLVLDISYRPVNVVCWKRAICLEFMEKADVLEYYDQTVSSPQGSFYIPAVLRVRRLLQAVKRRRIKHTLSRKSIFFRDSYTCQYCSSRLDCTIDHVLPISRGGQWKWENLVTACIRCNSKKGHKSPEEANMKLIKIPKAPKDYDVLSIPLTSAAVRMLKLRRGVPDEWRQYLPS